MLMAEELNSQLASLEETATSGSAASFHQPVCLSVLTGQDAGKADRSQNHNAVFYQLIATLALIMDWNTPGSLRQERLYFMFLWQNHRML